MSNSVKRGLVDADISAYKKAKHADMVKLTRYAIAMPFGDLCKMHKDKALQLGPISPSVVFLRALIFARLVYGQRNGKVP